ILDDVYWSPGAVWKSDFLEINAEMVIDRCQEVLGADAALDHVLAAAVGGPNDSAGRDAATCPEHRVGRRPVVAARLDRSGRPACHPATAAGHVGDLRRPSELASHHDQ